MAAPTPSVSTTVKDKAARAGQSRAQRLVAVFGVSTGALALLSAITSTGTTPPTLTASGYPIKDASIVLDIEGGATTFRWSDDGGESWREEGVTIPNNASYALPGTGVTIAFPNGASYAADNLYTLTARKIPTTIYANANALVDEHTGGPGVEAAVDILTQDGDRPQVMFCPIPASVAGTIGDVTKTTTPAITTSGTPRDSYQVRGRIKQTGARGVGSFELSLDGSDTYGPETAIPSNGVYVVTGTGVTITFASGTYTAGETFRFDTTAPGYSLNDLAATFDAFKRNNKRVKFILVDGLASGANDAARATASATVVATLSTKLAELKAARLPTRVIYNVAEASDDAIKTAFASTVEPRVMACASFTEHLSPITQRLHKRPFAWAIASLAAIKPMSVDLSSPAEAGPFPPRIRAIYRDETKTPGLNDARFCVARTWDGDEDSGLAGFYCNNPNTLAQAGSDFELFQHGLIVDEAEAVAYPVLVQQISRRLRLDKNGRIDSADANAIDTELTVALAPALAEHVVSFRAEIVRSDVFTGPGTKKLRFRFRFVSFFYPKEIEAEFAFEDAAIDAAIARAAA